MLEKLSRSANLSYKVPFLFLELELINFFTEGSSKNVLIQSLFWKKVPTQFEIGIVLSLFTAIANLKINL